MRTLKFYGSSDDLMEIEGSRDDEPDEVSPGTVQLVDYKTDNGLRVSVVYSKYSFACWSVCLSPLSEDVDIPDWPIRMSLASNGYSVQLEIDVPDSVKMYYIKGKE